MKSANQRLNPFDSDFLKESDAKEDEKKLTLKYSLFDLPTAQHKAGLAGLLVMIESMKRRGLDPLPEINNLGPTSVDISLTQKSLQVLFDDIFDAEVIEVQVKQKWKNTKPKATIEIKVDQEGNKKKEKRYLYDKLQPKGLFLQTFFPDADGAWVQLWRNMLWNILRAQPATRKVYKERSQAKASSLGVKVFSAILKEQKDHKARKNISESIAGSVFIGAQDKNAELVSFTGTPANNLLLHFWHIVSLIFIPRSFTIERSKGETSWIKWQDYGFALVIPEPSHLEYFFGDIVDTLMRLETDLAGKSNRPKRAIIDINEESGLEYLYYLARHQSQRQGTDDCVNSVEIYHIQKRGNNVRMLASNRLVPRKNLLERYERLRSFRMNPIFKSFYLNNILQDIVWYAGSLKMLTTYPVELLVYAHGKTPANMPWFSVDAGRRFTDIKKGLEQMEEDEMKSKEGRDDLLAKRVYDLIRHYIWIKSESKSGRKVKSFAKTKEGKTIYPKEYREAVEKVSMDAFLAMRGRREQDFVEYFTGTICSIPQFLPEKDFLLVSQALIDDWEKVKALSMLAISASSYLSNPQQDNKGEES